MRQITGKMLYKYFTVHSPGAAPRLHPPGGNAVEVCPWARFQRSGGDGEKRSCTRTGDLGGRMERIEAKIIGEATI
jgi:hypothetical protein